MIHHYHCILYIHMYININIYIYILYMYIYIYTKYVVSCSPPNGMGPQVAPRSLLFLSYWQHS